MSEDDKVPDIPPTDLIYHSYEGNFQLNCEAKVLWSKIGETKDTSPPSDDVEANDGTMAFSIDLALDRTTMHAQGGGQPTDVGEVTLMPNEEESDQGTSPPSLMVATIHKVLLDRDTKVSYHTGIIRQPNKSPSLFPLGSTVKVSVDPDQRRILSECHTAGHVVDAAMARCNQILPASKGYHFLDSPYVEYSGTIPPDQRESLVQQLQEAFKELVQEDIATEIKVVDRDIAQEECARLQENFNIDNFTSDQQVRIVTVAGWTCPCGGTHVKTSKDLFERRWGITGLKCKKGVVRVKYGQDTY